MKILYCIDMQVDFVTGVLGSEYAQAIVPNVVKKVRKHLENGNPVIFTRDTHLNETYAETREGKHLPIPHCIMDTKGWELIPELMEIYEEYRNSYINITHENETISAIQCVIGNKMDRFGIQMFNVSEHEMIIEEEMFPETELIGIATNMCVISTAILLQTFKTNSEITIDAACCASFDPELHEKALDVMESLQMNVINR